MVVSSPEVKPRFGEVASGTTTKQQCRTDIRRVLSHGFTDSRANMKAPEPLCRVLEACGIAKHTQKLTFFVAFYIEEPLANRHGIFFDRQIVLL